MGLLKKIKRRIRKVVPKEVAGIMTAAAPFVAPYSLPAAAALTIGGQLKQTGRINPILTAGSLLPGVKFRGGQGPGAFIPSGFERFGDASFGSGITSRQLLFGGPGMGESGKLGAFGDTVEKFLFGTPGGEGPSFGQFAGEEGVVPSSVDQLADISKPTRGLFGAKGKFNLGQGKLIRKGKVGDNKLNLTNIAALAATGVSLASANKQIEEEAIEEGASESDIDALKAEAADFWSTLSSSDFAVTPTLAKGGRVGFQDGTDVSPTIRSEKMANYKALSEPLDYGRQLPPFLKRIPIKYEQSRDDFETMQKERFMYDYNKPKIPEKILNKIRDLLDKDDRQASAVLGDESDDIARELFGKPYKDLNPAELEEFNMYLDNLEKKFIKKYFKNRTIAAKGGIMRQNLALGTRPTAQESGLGGLPIEADMRYSGGFMPYGAKEKADDVPARLSKNEFVFTADAVRAAGGGSVQKGAQRMYNTMKQLEAMGRS